MRVVIVVASASGRTARMAEALGEGVRQAGVPGAEAVVSRAEDAQAALLDDADAVVLGSGVHMGGMEPAMSAFLERTAPAWMQGSLMGRLGAAFVTAGAGAGGGAELTLLSMLAALAEHGMLIVPMHNRLDAFGDAGCHWGPVAWTAPRQGEAGPTDRHLDAARAHGSWVAQCAARWRAGAVASKD